MQKTLFDKFTKYVQSLCPLFVSAILCPPFKNYEKCFLFHLKSSFRSRDIQMFVIFSLPFRTFQIQKDK